MQVQWICLQVAAPDGERGIPVGIGPDAGPGVAFPGPEALAPVLAIHGRRGDAPHAGRAGLPPRRDFLYIIT